MRRSFKRNSTAQSLRVSGTMKDESGLEQQQIGTTALSTHGVTINDAGLCTMCGKTSVCKCERCGDFYCSPLCQRKDWPNHRFICFPMPRLVNAGLKEENQNGGDDNVPQLRMEIKQTDLVKAENRHLFKARKSAHVPLETPLPKAGCCVILTGFRSSNRCYIRSANPAITEEYLKLLKEIDMFGKNSTELRGTPIPNSLVIAKKDGKWCRVKILKNLQDNQVRVQFIDFGTTSVLKQRELRQVTEMPSIMPSFVNIVQLDSITNYSVDENLVNKLSRFTGKEYKIQYVDNDETSGNVELYYWGTSNLLNSEINNICRDYNENGTKVVSKSSSLSNNDVKPKSNGDMEKKVYIKSYPSDCAQDTTQKCGSEIPAGRDKKRNLAPRQIQIQKPCLEPPFETILFDKNDHNITVYVVDSSNVGHGYIGCLHEKYGENLQSITKYLKNYSPNEQPYTPKLNEYCLAEFENEWYRAKIIEVLGEDKYQVVYIDFSNELELTSKSIRHYPMSLTQPCCTSLCLIEGLPEDLSDDLIEFLEHIFGFFQKLTVDTVKIEEGVTVIESKELIKKLRDAELI